MPHHIVLTHAEANQILALLSELPIKYLGLVQQVQQVLASKFLTSEDSQHDAGAERGSGTQTDPVSRGNGYGP